MAWKIEYSNNAVRTLSKMQTKDLQRIIEKLEKAAESPPHYFKRLTGADDYKLRVGDYRILVLLLHSKNTVFVEKIGHRKNVYKK